MPPVMSHWSSSLPTELTIKLAESSLAGDDIDSYMAFRSVCHNWRKETEDKPGKVQDYTDPTIFQPRKWALLDKKDDLVTFVNVDTGRFLCKSIQVLHRHLFVGATSGGLLLLGEKEAPHQARLLNPFTGCVARFKVSVPAEGVRTVAVTTKPLIVFVSLVDGDILWADQTGEYFKRFNRLDYDKPSPITFFDGEVYATDPHGAIFTPGLQEVDDGEEPCSRSAATIWMSNAIPILNNASPDASPVALHRSARYYLVESGGDLLLVTRPLDGIPDHQPLVRKVDVKLKVLEPVTSIGNRAIFVSHVRCLSIDADKFQGIRGGCIYFVEPTLARGDYGPSTITAYEVDGPQGLIMFEQGILEGCSRPFTIAQVLADYCRSVHYHELYEMINNYYWDWEFSDHSDETSSSDCDFEQTLLDLEDADLSWEFIIKYHPPDPSSGKAVGIV